MGINLALWGRDGCSGVIITQEVSLNYHDFVIVKLTTFFTEKQQKMSNETGAKFTKRVN